MKRILTAAVVTICLMVPALVSASSITFSASDLAGRSASATFDDSTAGDLVVTLSNDSTLDVFDPKWVLTAVFFSIDGSPTLTPISALLPAGTTVFFGSNGGGNVGGEWGYAHPIGSPFGANQGISSSGLGGVFGDANFNGADLQNPAALDGLQYGITSTADDPSTGNKEVTGNQALIKHSVVFTLSGLPEGFDLADISNVSFQYGTSMDDPHLVPEPASMLLLGTGLLGAGFLRRRRK